MKKIFTLFAASFLALGAMAQDAIQYTDDMYVTINEETAGPMQATILVTPQENGNYTLALKNFVLTSEDGDMPVGNVEVTDIVASDADGYTALAKTDDIMIAEGDDPNMDFWMGPLICGEVGAIPVIIEAKMTAEKLFALITIDLSQTALEQKILVTFGEDNFPTGIKSVSESESDGCFYNIAGQRVAANAKGLVINNGKKFINK